MKYIGAHVSISGGVYNAPLNAQKINARAFGMFTKNQLRWNAKEIKREDIKKFHRNLNKAGISSQHVLVHDTYLINLANPVSEKYNKSLNAFIDGAKRVEKLGLKYFNFHPGSTLGKISDEKGLELISDAVNKTLEVTEDVVLVLETTAGQGNDLGYKFEHLASIIKNSQDKNRMGVCIDTAHIFGAGYDIRTRKSYNGTMENFDKVIGLKYLKGVHLNDSKVGLNSRKDRHANVGQGIFGWDVFEMLMKDERLNDIPLIMETKNSSRWKDDIKRLYSFVPDYKKSK
ncbi:MAG: deoxyribonuclease IV [Candidatus Mcinerneyibacterium aminivorans]|uniref:Probable endonuclease 4 n=1 Tax=Candidatus Mcinerneyibacterium aminivorans TaxID=2703815 RepID=A0A5D0MLP2_9BACT|nr:MAG: deoxyribonuclease IV [Candidatus Mcinerneyibacterium aminivorans]